MAAVRSAALSAASHLRFALPDCQLTTTARARQSSVGFKPTTNLDLAGAGAAPSDIQWPIVWWRASGSGPQGFSTNGISGPAAPRILLAPRGGGDRCGCPARRLRASTPAAVCDTAASAAHTARSDASHSTRNHTGGSCSRRSQWSTCGKGDAAGPFATPQIVPDSVAAFAVMHWWLPPNQHGRQWWHAEGNSGQVRDCGHQHPSGRTDGLPQTSQQLIICSRIQERFACLAFFRHCGTWHAAPCI